jgi:hypothetical protein
MAIAFPIRAAHRHEFLNAIARLAAALLSQAKIPALKP